MYVTMGARVPILSPNDQPQSRKAQSDRWFALSVCAAADLQKCIVRGHVGESMNANNSITRYVAPMRTRFNTWRRLHGAALKFPPIAFTRRFKTWGGGGRGGILGGGGGRRVGGGVRPWGAGGFPRWGGGGGCARPTTTTCIPPGGMCVCRGRAPNAGSSLRNKRHLHSASSC